MDRSPRLILTVTPPQARLHGTGEYGPTRRLADILRPRQCCAATGSPTCIVCTPHVPSAAPPSKTSLAAQTWTARSRGPGDGSAAAAGTCGSARTHAQRCVHVQPTPTRADAAGTHSSSSSRRPSSSSVPRLLLRLSFTLSPGPAALASASRAPASPPAVAHECNSPPRWDTTPRAIRAWPT